VLLGLKITNCNHWLHPSRGSNEERTPAGADMKLLRDFSRYLLVKMKREAIMKKPFILVATLFLVSVQPALSAELTILTENMPPLNYVEDGVLVGPSVEIIKEIQRRVGSKEEIKVYPWARAYKMCLEQENVVLFGMTHTEVRHEQFKWIGPLATKRDILVAKKGSGIRISSLEDAKKVNRIGTLRDDTRERLLTSLGFTNLEPVSDEQLNAKKLVLGRIDLWTYKIPGLRTVCELAGVDYNEVEEVYHLREINLDIAFSKKTSDLIVQRWRNAFNDMLADGTIMNIRKKWNMKLPEAPFPELEDKL
jgi:polar amino acid transport system substrate-binding protein